MGLLQYYLHREGKLQNLMKTLFDPKNTTEGFINRHPDPNVIFDNEVPNLEHPVQDLENNPTLAQGRQFAKISQTPDPTQPNARQIFKDTQAHRFAESVKRDMSGKMIQENKDCMGPVGGYPGEPSFKPQQIVCKKSSEANPFNNAMPYDPIDRQIYPSCPDENTKTDNFHKNLFKDVNDVFNKANGQLNFHSNPATTKINDREAFMQFLFNTPYAEYPEGA